MYITKVGNEKGSGSKFPIKLTCKHCKSEFVIEEGDELFEGYGGLYYVRCPVCSEKVYIDELDGITITKDNIKFPDHFYYFGNGKDISAEEIEGEICRGIEWFRKNPDSFSWSTGYGNMYIHIGNFSGDKEYYVTVAKGYYDVEIPYDSEDYLAQNSIDWAWENKGIHIDKRGKDE